MCAGGQKYEPRFVGIVKEGVSEREGRGGAGRRSASPQACDYSPFCYRRKVAGDVRRKRKRNRQRESVAATCPHSNKIWNRTGIRSKFKEEAEGFGVVALGGLLIPPFHPPFPPSLGRSCPLPHTDAHTPFPCEDL
eukprot:Sspe_Gene.74212::Locus_45733_Transcript_1_1_Confidence_1.000_Length_688::g.74212::m.74212